jgi:hypothetical protein
MLIRREGQIANRVKSYREYHAALVQRMMDAGMTRTRADHTLQDILWTHECYDTLDSRIKRAINLGFRRRHVVDYAWS